MREEDDEKKEEDTNPKYKLEAQASLLGPLCILRKALALDTEWRWTKQMR